MVAATGTPAHWPDPFPPNRLSIELSTLDDDLGASSIPPATAPSIVSREIDAARSFSGCAALKSGREQASVAKTEATVSKHQAALRRAAIRAPTFPLRNSTRRFIEALVVTAPPLTMCRAKRVRAAAFAAT
jgi:hypothetical protein